MIRFMMKMEMPPGQVAIITIFLLGASAERRPTAEIVARTYWLGETPSSRGASGAKPCQRDPFSFIRSAQ